MPRGTRKGRRKLYRSKRVSTAAKQLNIGGRMSEQEEILVEQNDDETPIDVPVDRRRVKTDKKDLPVDTIYGWVSRGKVNPQPDFQRYYVWNNTKASRLIESLLLDIPIPVVYVAEELNKTYSVVDGQQRITSVCS